MLVLHHTTKPAGDTCGEIAFDVQNLLKGG